MSNIKPLTAAEKTKGLAKEKKSKSSNWTAIFPIPEDAPKPIENHPEYGEPERIYTYKNQEGKILGYNYRFEFEGGEKKPLPLTYGYDKDNKNPKWRFKGFGNNAPLFGLQQLTENAKNKHILIVEGEKCAVAAKKLLSDYISVTSIGGSNAAHKSDWSPLAGRDILIWRDNDENGKTYEKDVIKELHEIGIKSITTLSLPLGMQEKWDIADAADEGWSRKKTLEFIDNHKKKYKILPTLTVEELLSQHIPERKKYLNWLTEGSLNMVFAKTGLGKTHFCLSLCAAIASGNNFLHWKSSEAAGVLYIDGEMALADMQSRIKDALQAISLKKPFEILSHEELFRSEEKDLNLAEPEYQERLKSYLEQNPHIDVVVIDNLSCLLPTIREDKRDDWVDKILPFLIWFRRRNIAVILVHHTNKKGEQRGSSAREDILDCVIELSTLPDQEKKDGAGFYVNFTKNRSVFGDAVKPIAAKLKKQKDGNRTWTWLFKEESSEDMLMSLVQSGVTSVKDAAEAMQMSASGVSKVKTKLIEQGLLKNETKLKLTE